MRGRASVTLLWCWTTCDVDIYVEREGEMFYPTFCVCSAGRGPDTSVSVTTVLQCYNTLVSLISVAISLWHWQVMKSIISSTTRALLAVRLQSTQLIFICVSDWLCFRDRQCDCDTKSDLWLVWAADPPTQWPDCEWTISILTDTEIKYSGVLTSVSLSVSRLSNVITTRCVSVWFLSVSVIEWRIKRDHVTNMLPVSYSNFPYYFVATSQCSKSSSNKFSVQVFSWS